MRRMLLVAVVVWLPVRAQAQPGSQPVSAQQAALALLDAVAAGDLATADAGCISFEAWRAISKRALDPADHLARHRGFVRGLNRELSRGATIAGVELKDVLVLPAGVKRHKAVVMAVFHLGLRFPGEKAGPPMQIPLMFLQVGDAWYLMVKD